MGEGVYAGDVTDRVEKPYEAGICTFTASQMAWRLHNALLCTAICKARIIFQKGPFRINNK